MTPTRSRFSLALATTLFVGIAFGVFTVYTQPTATNKGEVKGVGETASSISSSSSSSSSQSDKDIPVLD
jgi:hypothetical protein